MNEAIRHDSTQIYRIIWISPNSFLGSANHEQIITNSGDSLPRLVCEGPDFWHLTICRWTMICQSFTRLELGTLALYQLAKMAI